MKKYFRKSRMTLRNVLILLSLLAQFALIFVIFWAITLVGDTLTSVIISLSVTYGITFIFLFRLLYSQEDPEFKIPWICLFLVFPGVGILIYLFLKQRGLRYIQRKVINDIKESCAPFFQDKITQKDKRYATSNYQPITFLENVGEYCAHKNNRLTYYKCGEEFFPDFINKLQEAKEFIFMEFFIIRDGTEWRKIHRILKQKVKEGVEVRILYDDFGCFNYLPATYAMKLRKEGINCYRFNRVGPLLRGSYNNRTHRKIVVIDHKYGFTGGMNIGDEYANDIKEFGYWKDSMVQIEGSCINNLIALFLENFDLNRHHVSTYGKYLNHQYEEYQSDSLIYFFGTGPSSISPIRKGEQNYVNIIEAANKTLYISTPYLIPSNDLLHSLQRAACRGVDVHLILPGIPDKKIVYLVAKYYFAPLLQNGIKIYTYTPGFNHMKAILADDKVAFIGTINMDYRSLVHHFECGLTMVNDPLIPSLKEDFITMVNESKIVPTTFSLNLIQRLICSLLRLFMPLL